MPSSAPRIRLLLGRYRPVAIAAAVPLQLARDRASSSTEPSGNLRLYSGSASNET
jgi:hypothetical protein